MWTIEYCSSVSLRLSSRQGEILIQQGLAGSRRIDAAQFVGHEVQRSEALHRFGKSVQQQARFPALDGARFDQRESGSHGHRQILNEKPLAVVQAGEGNRPERAVRNEHQRIDVVFGRAIPRIGRMSQS